MEAMHENQDRVIPKAVEEKRAFPMGIGEAIEEMRAGHFVSRDGWNGKGQSLRLQAVDENSMNTLPYIQIITVQGHRVPWVCSQTDLLATDWFVVKQ